MKNQFFKDVINLAPQQQINFDSGVMSWGDFADKGRVENARLNIMNELKAFRAYLMERQSQDRITILEYTTGELMAAYYAVRMAMKDLTNTERDKGRPSMNTLYEAIAVLTICADRELRIEYSKEFLTSWVSRGDHILAPILRKRENAIKEPVIPEKAEKIFDKNAFKMQVKYNKKLYEHYGKDDNYMEYYLKDIYDAMNPKKEKQNLGGVCLVLHEAKIFKIRNFVDLLKLLAEYWDIEVPGEKHPNKYRKKAEEFKMKYCSVITPF